VFLQDDDSMHSTAASIAQHCATHLSTTVSLASYTSDGLIDAKAHSNLSPYFDSSSSNPALPSRNHCQSTLEETEASSTEASIHDAATPSSMSYISPFSHPRPFLPIAEALLQELRGLHSHQYRPASLPEGLNACMHPACKLTSHRCYLLDRSSRVVHAAFQDLPIPIQTLTDRALELVMQALPLHACTYLAPALRVLSLCARVVHMRSGTGTKCVGRSLCLCNEALQPEQAACMLRYVPLVPSLHSLDLSNSRFLNQPFPKRGRFWGRSPPLPRDRAIVGLWITLRIALRALAPSLTHLNLARSTIDRSALYEMVSVLSRLESLDITKIRVTAPQRVKAYDMESMHADILSCISRLPLCLRKLQARMAPHFVLRARSVTDFEIPESRGFPMVSQPKIRSLSHGQYRSCLTELDFSNHRMRYMNARSLNRLFTAHLTEMVSLVSLDLSGSSFCDPERAAEAGQIFSELFKGLYALRNLQKLVLKSTLLLEALPRADCTSNSTRTMGQAKPFHEYLSELSSLTYLDISGSKSQRSSDRLEAGWQFALAPALGRLFRLRELHASFAGLSLQAAATLMHELARVTCIQVLDLSGNGLGGHACAAGRPPGLIREDGSLRCSIEDADAVDDELRVAKESDLAAAIRAHGKMILLSIARMRQLTVLKM
jgi:hypothetical protein